MALQQRLIQKQAQTLAMTKQLRQAIELLELSSLDLQQTVEGYLEENPLLVMEEAEYEGSEKDRGDTPLDDPIYDNQFHDSGRSGPPPDRTNPYNEFGMENLEGQEVSLYGFLEGQIRTHIPDPQEQFLAFALLYDLEPSGYLDVDEKAFCKRLGCEEEMFDIILSKLQGLEPAGVFARSLKECLAIQLDMMGELTQRFKIFLEHLELLGKGDLLKLGKLCGCEQDELKEMIQEIRELNPKPGLQFDHADIPQRQPDVYVFLNHETGEFDVRLDEKSCPKVRMDSSLAPNVDGRDKNYKAYIGERMTQAQWLLKALQQRQENLYNIAKAIAQEQKDFFQKGVAHLKPMTLKQIAGQVDVHESTVSRITQNKYLACAQGLFDLKFFFSSNISNAWTGEDQSALAIQHAIQKLVDQEPAQKPLSDDQLVKYLCEMDISVARRTVTKYRELLKIPSSYDRARRYKLEKLSA